LTNNNDGDIFIRPGRDWGFRSYYTTVTLIDAQQWYRMVFSVKMGESARYYLNGVLIDTKSSAADLGIDSDRASWPLDHVLLFGDESGEDNVFDVAEVAIWNKALTAGEIKSLGGAGN
jgi:hypothetical protein